MGETQRSSSLGAQQAPTRNSPGLAPYVTDLPYQAEIGQDLGGGGWARLLTGSPWNEGLATPRIVLYTSPHPEPCKMIMPSANCNTGCLDSETARHGDSPLTTEPLPQRCWLQAPARLPELTAMAVRGSGFSFVTGRRQPWQEQSEDGGRGPCSEGSVGP